MILKGLYTILLGIFLTLFIGIGISTFYPEPTYQAPTPCLAPATPKLPQDTTGVQNMNKECERAQLMLQNQRNFYVQIMSSILLVVAVVYLFLGLNILQHVELFAFGFLFGSIFTLLYSVLRGLETTQAPFKFILVTFSLGIVLWVGYAVFIKQSHNTSSLR